MLEQFYATRFKV